MSSAKDDRPISQPLRDAVRASGRSLNALAEEADFSTSILVRFMNQQTRLRMDHADSLARVLGLALRKKPRKK